MKILGTVSRRSKGKIFIELFQFRGLLMVWDLSISYEPRSLCATREGKRCTKGSVQPGRHPSVQLGERASAQARESFARQNGQNGRGTAPSWAGATPLFHTVPCPKVTRGSLQPNKKLPWCARREFGRSSVLSARITQESKTQGRRNLGAAVSGYEFRRQKGRERHAYRTCPGISEG